ncbi:MAG: Rpn family recombination-promoting nuclease/putative transposase [Thermoguttaceae bacterium]
MSRKPSEPISHQPSNIHDQFVKAVFAHTDLVAEFLKLYAEPDLVRQLELTKIKQTSTHFMGEENRERIADLIFTIPLKKGAEKMEVVFIFEHKSERRRSLGLQLLKYLAAIWNQQFSEAKNRESEAFFLAAPLLIVLHNGSKPIIDRPTLEKMVAKVVGTEKFIPRFEYDLVDLPALAVEELGEAPLLRVILELLKRGTDGTLYDVQTEILEPLAAIRDDPATREWMQRILRYMDQILAAANKPLTVETVDAVIRPVYKERSKTMAMGLFDQIEARGEAKGELKSKVDDILAILEERFESVPKLTIESLNKRTDLTAMKSLVVLAATCKSLDEFENALR